MSTSWITSKACLSWASECTSPAPRPQCRPAGPQAELTRPGRLHVHPLRPQPQCRPAALQAKVARHVLLQVSPKQPQPVCHSKTQRYRSTHGNVSMHSADRGVRTTRQRGGDTHAQQAVLTRGIVQTGCHCRPYCKDLNSVSVDTSTYTHTQTHTARSLARLTKISLCGCRQLTQLTGHRAHPADLWLGGSPRLGHAALRRLLQRAAVGARSTARLHHSPGERMHEGTPARRAPSTPNSARCCSTGRRRPAGPTRAPWTPGGPAQRDLGPSTRASAWGSRTRPDQSALRRTLSRPATRRQGRRVLPGV